MGHRRADFLVFSRLIAGAYAGRGMGRLIRFDAPSLWDDVTGGDRPRYRASFLMLIICLSALACNRMQHARSPR